jgi:hypothetical protein
MGWHLTGERVAYAICIFKGSQRIVAEFGRPNIDAVGSRLSAVISNGANMNLLPKSQKPRSRSISILVSHAVIGFLLTQLPCQRQSPDGHLRSHLKLDWVILNNAEILDMP